MGSTWKPHGVHMETTCCPHANHVVYTWKPCGVNMVTMLCQHENNMVSTWYLDTIWFLYTCGHNVVTVVGQWIITVLCPLVVDVVYEPMYTTVSL